MTGNAPPASWRFDGVEVEPARFRVLVRGVPQPIEPKAFRLLHFLIENRDRVVSKDEIFKVVWADTFVTDNALTRAIAQIRKAIGDDPRNPRYIETVQTVGYRFIADIQEPAAASSPVPPLAEPTPVPVPTRRLVYWTLPAAAMALAALALWVGAQGRGAQPDRSGIEFLPVQFSSSPGLDAMPSFSRDGALVAYASDRTGTFEIFVKSFDASARELQLTADGNQNLYPAFSPDGRWVAFASVRGRGIFRVPAIGGPVQRLTEFGVQPVWSPDSQTIVFRSTGSASLSTTDYYWPAESSLWVVPAAGGEARRLTGTEAELDGGQSFPSFSADGAEVRFVNHFKGESSVWALRLADGRARKLFGSPTLTYSNATFAPDDSRVWFVNWRLNGEIGIWQLALDPATLAPAGEPAALYPSPFAVPRDLSLSSDGKRLAFTAVLSDSAVLTQDISEGASPITLTHEKTYRYGIVRSSADGRRVVYVAFPRNGRSRLWIVNADGSEARAFGVPDVDVNYGSLSPDNRLFAVEYRNRDGRVVSYRLADGAVERLGDLPPGASQVVCSLDCSRVAFHDPADNRRRLWVQEMATGTRRVLASGQEHMGFGRFSRDDKWLTVEITHPDRGGDDLGVLPAAGGPVQVILKSDLPTYGAGWMPDNDRILFAGFRDGAWNVYTVSRTTRKVERLTSYTSMRTYVRYPDWLAGDRMVYEFNETKGNIFVANVAR